MSLDKPHYKVVAAAIFEGDSFYCFKKGKSKYSYSSYKFEFPCGKIISGETQQQELKREIKEEFNRKFDRSPKFLTEIGTVS